MPASARRPDIVAAASALPPAALELLMERSLQERTDWKLPVHVDQLPTVLRLLADTHAAVPSTGTPVAHYATAYYDTPDLRCFHDHRRGRAIRHKVRFRDYTDRQITRLEVKRRTGRGDTLKYFLLRPFRDHSMSDEALAFLEEHLPWDPRTLQRTLELVFYRITLVAADREERITLDHGLGAQHVTTGACHDYPSAGVIEVKCPSRQVAGPTLRALAGLGIRSGSMSKYCLGMAVTDPALRSHSLRPMVRRVERLKPRA